MPVMPDERRRGWRAGHSVAKVIVSLVTFLSALVGLLAALIALSVVDNPFESKIDQLARAGAQLSDAGSARVNIARVIRTSSGGQQADTGSGSFDFRGESGTVKYASGLKQIFRRPYLFQTTPDLGKTWCKYDVSQLGSGFLFGAMTGFESDPGAAVGNLDDNGESEKIGDEILFGIPASHYSGYLHLDKLRGQTPDPRIRELIDVLGRLNDGKLRLEVWVGKSDDRVLQLASRFDVPGADYGLEGRVNIDATISFSRHGLDVVVEPPPSVRIAGPGDRGCPVTP